MNIAKLIVLVLALALSGAARARDVIHHGPTLEVEVQRGDARLPLSLVDRLRAGDVVTVRPDVDTLARGDWVLLLARVSPRGNQVESSHHDVRAMTQAARLEITADDQAPVVVLAPQLRNLFGLTTSLYESARLLDDVLRADPQRFHGLQNADQVNHAIRAIGQGLAQRVAGRGHEQAVRETRALAARFGVREVDPECFRNQSVDTECVAAGIVADREFALPSTGDLSAMVGPRKSADLNSFLAANLRVLTDAADYLASRYRDTYDFAPTFGRRSRGSNRVELFSIARFRSGGTKTAYLYVPSWFTGTVPALSPERTRTQCHARGSLDVRVQGRLPLIDYWHGWRMTVSDPGTQEVLAEIDAPTFEPESGRFSFAPARIDPARPPSADQVVVRLEGRFGFEPVTLEPIRMALPMRDRTGIAAALAGLDGLVSGERTVLRFHAREAGACVREMALALPGGTVLRSEADAPAQLEADLRQVPPGRAELTVEQHGAEPIVASVRILPPRARVARIEHADLEDTITVFGERLERIARIEAGAATCSPGQAPIPAAGGSSLRLACRGDVRGGARGQDPATVFHRDDAPGPQRHPVIRTAARPRFEVAADTPNALLVAPSAKALRWELSPTDELMTEDSGLGLLLRARRPYVPARGSYQLQLRFRDDPQSDERPLTVPLIADFAHGELRTRSPVGFRSSDLPGVVNPLEYRVVHQPSGLAGDWQALGRSVLMLPELQSAACAPAGDAWWVQGSHLDLIAGVRIDAPGAAGDVDFAPARLVPCPSGLCLSLPPVAPEARVRMRVRWVDGRVFSVRLPAPSPACP